MHRTILRERLLYMLQERHRLAVIALESPPGFGRSILLDQAIEAGPPDASNLDLIHRCNLDDALEGHLAIEILALCGVHDPESLTSTDEAAQRVASALSVVGGDAHIALFLDDLERAGEAGEDFIRALVERLPGNCHLVLSGRRLLRIGLARMVANGSASLIGTAKLAFNSEDLEQLAVSDSMKLFGDPILASWPALASLILQGHSELIVDYINETFLPCLDDLLIKGLAALSAVDGAPTSLVESVLGAALAFSDRTPVNPDLVATDVMSLPLVGVQDGCWPHPIWASATATKLAPRERDAAVLAKIRGLIAEQSTHDAGRQAIQFRSAAGLAAVVRAALATAPPRASVADLRTWAASELLAGDSVEQLWLSSVIELQVGDRDGSALRRLEEVRERFETAGDHDGEVSVLLHLGIFARASSDAVKLVFLLQRAAALAAEGNAVAAVLVALGEALTAQLMGNPKDAIAILERIPPGTLSGEWASQALMMRGTNLLLAGRISEALQALHSSTGEGTPYTRSIAHDLLSTAKWYSGDPIGAIDEADQAERLALNSTTTWIARQRTAWKACLFAATGQLSLAESLLSQYHRESGDEETEAIVRIAEVLLLCERNEIEEAHDLLAKTDVPARATRAATWKASLGIALAFSENGELLDGQGEDLAMQLAGAAGHAAARHLSGGALAKSVHRPYLPTSWCEPDASSTRVRLTGASGISRDGVAVEHRSWARNRVRELLLHLVLVENATRSLVAASLWPDLLDRDAGRNLRVTLTHLLDVLDPERAPASGSSFIVDTEGTLSLNRSSGLWVDIWEHDQYAVALLMTPDHERQTLLAHARRLVGFAWGPLLGGIALGEWVEPHTRRRNELRISALLRGGSHALAAAEYKLAEVLALSAMDVDPWSQQAHNLLIESRIDVGDMDGARRAFTQAIETFRDLGVTPVFPVSSISHRLGLSFTA